MKCTFVLSIVTVLLMNVSQAAVRVDLSQQSSGYIKGYFKAQSPTTPSLDQLTIISRNTDFNQTAHMRLQQTYDGLPVWNATSVIHVPNANGRITLLANLSKKTSMNGVIYKELEKDLTGQSAIIFSNTQRDRALQIAKRAFENKIGVTNPTYQKESIKNIVYITDDNKAHYAYLVSIYYDDGQSGAHIPTCIIDAETLETYLTWDKIFHSEPIVEDYVLAGGIGGNEKTGEIVYDGGTKGHIPVTQMKHERYMENNKPVDYCILKNENINVVDVSYATLSHTKCEPNKKHNGIYWLSLSKNNKRWKKDQVNGGYSPSLDAFYNGTVVLNFYREWYNINPLVLEDKKTPMPLRMRVHYGRNYQNAFWDGEQMTFGDGGAILHPLTALDVTAHEVSHGFTEQHSNINPELAQMGALHEAFSDEAAVTIRYYATGKINWAIGQDIFKWYFFGFAIRHLDDPTQDGQSIDHMNDFTDATEPHNGAGVFNKAFYLLATSKGWDIQKAFNVMLKANVDYWTSSMKTLDEAACGVALAAKDYQYDLTNVVKAFSKVGIDLNRCKSCK